MPNLRSFFGLGPSISRPAAADHRIGEIRFRTFNIYVRGTNQDLQGGGDFATVALQHLEEIRSFQVGQDLFDAISSTTRRVVLNYAGPNNNSAAGTPAGYKLLRAHHDGSAWAQFSTELAAAIGRSGMAPAVLARRLYDTQLPRWDGTSSVSPFRNPPRPPAAPRTSGAPKPLPATPVQLIEQMVANWSATPMVGGPPSRDEMDILCIVLDTHLANGPGVSTRICYDPKKTIVNGRFRPPHCGLFHEMVHAYYNVTGSQLGREDSLSEDNGGRLFELMAVGLAPFDTRPFSENQFREALGVALRPTYP